MIVHSFYLFLCGKTLTKVTCQVIYFLFCNRKKCHFLFSKRLPFSIHSVFDYYAVVLLQYGIWYFIALTFFCAIGFLVTSCKVVSMFLKDLTADWHTLNQINETNVHGQFKKKFHDLINVHSQIIQLSHPFLLSKFEYAH